MGNRIITWLAAAMAAGLLLVAGCVKEPLTPAPLLTRTTPADETQAVLRLGQDRLAKGQYPDAADAFRAALKMRGTSTQQGDARLGLAKALIGSGEGAMALDELKGLLASAPLPPVHIEAALLAAGLEREQGLAPAAAMRLRVLLANPPQILNPQERRQANTILSEALRDQGQHAQAAAHLLRMAPDTAPDQLADLGRRLIDTAGQAPSREVEPLLNQAGDPILRAALTLALAKAQLREGNSQQVEAALANLRQDPAAQVYQAQIQALAQELGQAQQVQASAVGVLLPLSGPYESHGRNFLAAVELGLGLLSGGNNSSTLFIEDSGNTPEQAVEALTRLAGERKVMAVIGPLESASALAVARQAQALKVPLIAPSVVEGVTKAGDYVFQNFFSPSDQVNAVLDEAMDRRGLKRLAVLAPRTSYGQGFAKLFDAGVLARGGQVAHTVFYDPNQTDFTNDIRQLAKLPPAYRGGRADANKPTMDFQALFIPDNVERVGLILPQLLYNDVSGVTLLGTNLWHNQKLMDMAGRFLQNAIIPDAFDLQDTAPAVAGFLEQFKQAMGHDPNVIDAHGYDSALILRKLLQSPQPPRTRAAMRQALAEVKEVPGVCGLLSVGADRRVKKPLPLFTARGDAFRRLDAMDAPGQAEPSVVPAPAFTPAGGAGGSQIRPAPPSR